MEEENFCFDEGEANENDWDDMAILNAFESALHDRSNNKRKKKNAKLHEGRNESRAHLQNNVIDLTDELHRTNINEREMNIMEESPPELNQRSPHSTSNRDDGKYHPIRRSSYQQQPQIHMPITHIPGMPSPRLMDSTPSMYEQKREGHTNDRDAYARAYAHAYAHAYSSADKNSGSSTFNQSHRHPYSRNTPTPRSFPSVSSSVPNRYPRPPAHAVHSQGGFDDDGLSELLLSWYHAGYYTGRHKAMQEMKLQQYYDQSSPHEQHYSHYSPDFDHY